MLYPAVSHSLNYYDIPRWSSVQSSLQTNTFWNSLDIPNFSSRQCKAATKCYSKWRRSILVLLERNFDDRMYFRNWDNCQPWTQPSVNIYWWFEKNTRFLAGVTFSFTLETRHSWIIYMVTHISILILIVSLVVLYCIDLMNF